MNNHKLPAQISRFTPDGTRLLVSSFSEPLLTIMPPGDLNSQQTLAIDEGPMDMAFHPNGETVWVANHNAGTISVVSINPFRELHRFSAGKGVETLEFYDRETFSTASGPCGQETQPSTKHCIKATFKRLTGMHISRTDMLSSAVIVLRSF